MVSKREIDAYQSKNRSARANPSQENEIRSENRAAERTQPSVTENRERRLENMTNEMNARITQEVDGLLFSVNTQIQRALDNAFGSEVIPQVQSAIRAVNGELPRERPDTGAEGLKSVPKVSSSRNDVSEGYNPNESLRDVSYNPRDAPYKSRKFLKFYLKIA